MCFVLQMYTDGPAKEPLYETIYFFKDMPLLIDIITLLTDILSHWNSRFENAWRWFICNTCAYTVLFFSPTVKKNAESVFINWMTGWFKLFYLLWRTKFFSWFFFFFQIRIIFFLLLFFNQSYGNRLSFTVNPVTYVTFYCLQTCLSYQLGFPYWKVDKNL